MNYFGKLSGLFSLLIFGVVISGCTATVPLMDEQYDVAAEKFQPVSGFGNIYVVRRDRFAGSAVAFRIELDGRSIGSIAPGTYHLFELKPGKHVIAATTMENAVNKEVIVIEGKNYFFEVKPKMGLIAARVSIEDIDAEEGRKLVIDGSRAQTLSFE